jgi:hypothetical protein
MTLLVHHLLGWLRDHLRLMLGNLLIQSLECSRSTGRTLNGRVAPVRIVLRRVAALTRGGIALAGSVLVFRRCLRFLVTGCRI